MEQGTAKIESAEGASENAHSLLRQKQKAVISIQSPVVRFTPQSCSETAQSSGLYFLLASV